MKIRSAIGVAAALCTSIAALAQPANDTCAGALVIDPAALPYNSGAINWTTATTDTNNNPSCDSGSNTLGAKFGCWWSFTPTVTGTYNISQTASQDTATSIWTGPCGAGQVQFSCSDPESSTTATLTAGTTYYIMVSKWNTSAATGTITFTLAAPPSGACCTAGNCVVGLQTACTTGSTFVGANTTCTPSPCVVNDACSAAIAVTAGVAVTANNATASSSGDGPAATCQSSSSKGIWYTYTPASSGAHSISTCGSSHDTVLQVYTTPDCVAFTAVACDDDTCAGSETGLCGAGLGSGNASLIANVALTGGTTYYIRVSSFGGAPAGGCITLLVTPLAATGACCNPNTGACTVVTQAACNTAGGSYQGDTTTCPNANCPASGSCCVGNCCSVLTLTGCATLGGSFTAAGTCAAGSCTAAVANDNCAGATALTLGVQTVGCNTGATTAVGEPVPTCQSSYGASVWHSFTPASSGYFNVGMCGTNFDSVLSVLSSPDCVTYTAVACDDDACVGGETGVIPGTTGAGTASVITGAFLTGGQLYYVRVAGFGSNTGTYGVTVTSNTVAGACCVTATGACSVSTSGTCPGGTTFVLGGVCTPNTCPQPTGACCNADGTCSVGPAASCLTGSFFAGVGTTCTGTGSGGCPSVVGACCNNTTGNCGIVVSGTCTASGSTYAGDGTVCSPNTCPQPGACCIGNCCTVTLQAACTGVWGPANSTCTASACGFPANDECAGATAVTVGNNLGSNCGATTSFVITPSNQCGAFGGSGGSNDVWHSFTPSQSANYTFSTCATPGFDTVLALYNACPADGTVAPRACNDDTAGTCALSTLRSEIPNQLLIAGQTYFIRVAAFTGASGQGAYNLAITQGAAAGACCTGTSCAIVLGFNCPPANYQGDFTSCSPNPCDPAGECCDPSTGGCTVTTQSGCTGNWTVGGTCSPNNCPQPNGACCCGSTCSLTSQAACVGTNTSFSGAGTTCNAMSNTAPCCYADYNKSGAISVQDIFDFLAAYFNGDACTDINASGPPPSVQDIFDFLSAYFAGGC